uniref:Tuberin N-terminal domain-containing protein n=1 Tax=Bionectria ochroleuca TaxID=29856 RepID=A0A8H7NG36_BIOOC
MDSFELLKNGSLSERISAANTLKYAVPEQPLNPVIDIWYAAKDLIEASRAPVARTAGWELLTECVKHTSSTDLERREYFQTLAAPANPEDFHLQLAAMVDLTRHGRLLVGFDYDLLPLLTRWLGEAYTAVRTRSKECVLREQGFESIRQEQGCRHRRRKELFSALCLLH